MRMARQNLSYCVPIAYRAARRRPSPQMILIRLPDFKTADRVRQVICQRRRKPAKCIATYFVSCRSQHTGWNNWALRQTTRHGFKGEDGSTIATCMQQDYCCNASFLSCKTCSCLYSARQLASLRSQTKAGSQDKVCTYQDMLN